MLDWTRRCKACFAPLGIGERSCTDCGYDGALLQAEPPLLPGVRLSGRYRVGGACDGMRWGFDERTRARVRLESYTGPRHEEFFFRADALSRVADCPYLVPVLDAFETAETAVCVHADAAGMPLRLRAIPLTERELMFALNAAADALLVLHSLQIAHGALMADRLFVTGDGALRLLACASPCEGTPAQDLEQLGGMLSLLHGSISKRVDDILMQLCAGRYGSVLELRHALNCFDAGEPL